MPFTCPGAYRGNDAPLFLAVLKRNPVILIHVLLALLAAPLHNIAAFHMTGNLNATRAEFSAIEITTGKTLVEFAETVSGAITYLDVTHGATGNTHATGGSPENTAWLDPVPGSIAANNTQWALRENLGTNGTIYQSIHSGNQMPELTTTITGLAVGDYDIWAFFWDGPNSNTWTISAGLESGALTTYSADGPGNTSAPVAASTLTFAGAPPLLTEDVRILHGVKIGRATVGQGSTVPVFVNNLSGGGSNTRTWFDGVGYALAADDPPPPPVPGALVLGIDFNRSDALGSPGQSLFRAVSGSATQAANAPSYVKNFGSRQVSVSQPDGEKLEFRGGNGDGTRAIPGGETSLSFLVSDFIATRKGAIDIFIANLAEGDYVFRSWHLDTFTGATHGFAQGVSTTSPNTIEARLGGALMGAVQGTSLGSVGLNTTYIGDAQIPQISFGFSHDGASPLIINLRSTIPNGAENFLLLNGFAINAATP